MATLSYQAISGTWSGTVNLNYSATYDRDKNQTTITFKDCTAVYGSAVGYASTTETTITVKNEAGTEKTVTLTTSLSASDAGGGTKTFTATPNPASVTLEHGSGAGKKTVEISAHTLFTLRPYSSSGLMYIGGDSETVEITSAELFTLTKSVGTGSSITVNNSTTGKTNLASGALVAKGDVLKISFGVSAGYNLGTHTVNGTTFTSGNTYTVSGNVTVKTTASVKSYSLSVSTDGHATVTVNRISSPLKGESTGNLSDGATIYYNDVLAITVSPSAGYEAKTATLNGGEIVSPHTVTGVVSIIVITSPLGFAYIDINTEVTTFSMLIDTGSAIERFRAYIDNGTSIVPY